MKSQNGDPLLAAWSAVSRRLGEQPAIFDIEARVLRTFAAIESESQAIERDLLSEIQPGQVLAIQLGNHPSWPAVLLACLRRRIVVLPLENTISAAERDAVFMVCGVAAAGVSGGSELEILPVETAAARTRLGSDTSFLKLTSGTTASPRAIRFRSDQLLADCRQICATMEITDRDLNFAVIPVSHSYGFSNLITPLLAHGVPMALSHDRMPRAVLDGLLRTEATVFPGMPVLYQAVCEIEEPPPLPALRLCISAGAPLPLELAKSFRALYGHSIHSFYGASECGGICYDRTAALVDENFVGPPMEGVELDFIDANAASGQMRVRSAAVGAGYFPDADQAKLGGGVFIPDDLLAQAENGLQVVGRVSDVINVAGKKVNPAEVEAVLLGFHGVHYATAFGRESSRRNEEVAACVVATPPIDEGALREHCRRRLSAWQVPKRIFFVDQIPVNERGKVSRRLLSERFRS
ncbi:MAG: class I adenylate-forming enzyme family protein [Chthoniobacterales bacterium]